MSLFLETGYVSLNKFGEELCGDKVESIRNGDYTTLVLADGLGSGVKASILSTLTSKILCTMIANGLELEDCVETIVKSLPVCKVRGVAYSTFSIIHIDTEGKGYLVEFDNPQAILIRDGKCQDFEREKLDIFGKNIYKTQLSLQENDVVIVTSDGVVHAGIGMLLNFGWQREEIKKFLEEHYSNGKSARAQPYWARPARICTWINRATIRRLPPCGSVRGSTLISWLDRRLIRARMKPS